jgi:uncharacterized protein YndB with AHSA1/START domain
MSVLDTTPKGQAESISFEFELQHVPEKVWRALTEPALLAEWLLPVVEQKLEPGGAFILKKDAQPGWDGIVNGRYLEIEEHKKLSYSWKVGDIDTVVTFGLTKTASGTRLSLVQSGFKPNQKHNSGGARYGWRMMGDKLVDLLARTP